MLNADTIYGIQAFSACSYHLHFSIHCMFVHKATYSSITQCTNRCVPVHLYVHVDSRPPFLDHEFICGVSH